MTKPIRETVKFNGASVMDSLHYQMLKEIYSDKIQGRFVDEEFEQRRAVFASIIVPLEQNKDCSLDDESIVDMARVLGLNRLIPRNLAELNSQQKLATLQVLEEELERVVEHWAEPKISPHVLQCIRRMFKLLLK